MYTSAKVLPRIHPDSKKRDQNSIPSNVVAFLYLGTSLWSYPYTQLNEWLDLPIIHMTHTESKSKLPTATVFFGPTMMYFVFSAEDHLKMFEPDAFSQSFSCSHWAMVHLPTFLTNVLGYY